MVVSCIWISHVLTEQQHRQAEQTLTSMLHTTHQGIRTWLREEQTRAKVWAQRPEIIKLTKQLLDAPRTQRALLDHPAQDQLRQNLRGVIKASNYDGFFIIAPDEISLGSMRNSNVGTPNLISSYTNALDKVWAGESVVSPPQQSDVPLGNAFGQLVDGMYTMFVLAPVTDRGQVIAALAFRIDITKELEPLLLNGRYGISGNNYVFDEDAKMVCHSLIESDPWTDLTIQHQAAINKDFVLRDPGVNLTLGETAELPREQQPLTLMAQSATLGQSGVNIEGYRDFRGIHVIGAWMWDSQIGFGLASEVEVAEAYQLLNLTNRALVLLTLVAVALGLGIVGVMRYQQHKLIEAEVRHRNLIANLPAAAYLMLPGSEYDLRYVSDQIESLTGYPAKQFYEPPNHKLKDMIHPQDQPRVIQELKKAQETGHPYAYEYRLINRDGDVRWVYDQGRVIYDEKEAVRSIEGVITDITERKMSQARLHEYQYALDTAAIVAITDRSGTINYVNDKFCEISKYPRNELIGANHRILNSGHHPKSFFVNMYRTLAREGMWRDEICNRAKDGSIYWVDTTIVAFHDAQGRIDRYVAIRADITESKKAHAELMEVNHQLKEKSHEMEQFTYSVSHDLKSPLVSCVGLLNFIEADIEAGDFNQVSDSIARIRKNINRMAQCIEDLFELSRIGRIPHKPQNLDMTTAAQQAVEGLRNRAQSQGVEIEIVQELPSAFADPVRIGEVYDNLINNALKYGCDGPIKKISIGWELVAGTPHYYVRDYGKGIPKEYQKKIFGLFQRLDKTKEGTGVGLTIVRRIMEIHGGRIWLESEEDKGTTFWFTLPSADQLPVKPADDIIQQIA